MTGKDICYGNCTGCGICTQVCGVKCISMETDKHGFVVPVVDERTCIQCGKCSLNCPENNEYKPNPESPQIWIGYAKNEKILQTSSSGGVFFLIAQRIIQKGGIVYGASIDECGRVFHSRVDNEYELSRLQKSKYAQSVCTEVYSQVKEDLRTKTYVLFVGTPCQVYALKMFLREEYENLILVDFFCHGIPSSKMFQDYVNAIKCKSGQKIRTIDFRDKMEGWRNFDFSIEYENKKKYWFYHDEDFYMRIFLKNLISRESCYDCRYKTLNRHSDITIADAWGVEAISKKIREEDGGSSIILLHTKMGEKIFDGIMDKMILEKRDIDSWLMNNPALARKTECPPEREKMLAEYEKGVPIITLLDNYSALSFKGTMKRRIKFILRCSIMRWRKKS